MLDLFEAGPEGQQMTIVIFPERSLSLPWLPSTEYQTKDSKKWWSILLTT
jgi:hypothetical protein